MSKNGERPDLKKRRQTEDALGRTVRASSTLLGGVAHAIGDGFEAYSERASTGSPLEIGLDNPLLDGTFAGYAAFFEGLAGTTRKVQEDLRPPAAPPSATRWTEEELGLLAELLRQRGVDNAGLNDKPASP